MVMKVLHQAWKWAFGALPPAERTVGPEFVWILCSFGIFGMLLGEFFGIKGLSLLSGFWRMYVHGGVGVLAMLAWVVYRGEVPRWFGAAVVLLGLFPLIWRLATNSRCFLQHEWLLVGPGSTAIVLSLFLVSRSSERLIDWGLGAGDWRWWCPRMLLAIVIMIPTVYGVMLADPSLASFYPVWTAAQTDFGALLWALLGVGIDMLGWEFLFRGALLFGLARRGDVHLAIWLQVFPFFLLHAGKPNSELILSIFGGVLSGWFCWRARCFWPLFVLHWVQLSCVNVIGFALR